MVCNGVMWRGMIYNSLWGWILVNVGQCGVGQEQETILSSSEVSSTGYSKTSKQIVQRKTTIHLCSIS